MPDPRPFSTLRSGLYDDPPASAEASTPRSRRSRLHHALRATADMALDALPDTSSSSNPIERVLSGPASRRRRRSPASSSRDGPTADDGAGPAGRRRSKRRKLDSETSTAPRSAIKYGHYGQVEPGRLRLEVISCDGGEHRDPRHPGTYLGPLNVLRHDKSVYCSEYQSTNLVIRHADDTPFCLEKLHVVGPEHGFTAPVREGLVYIAMTLNDLTKYLDPPPHARLEGIHTPPYRRRRNRRPSEDQITILEALRDPAVNGALHARQRASGRHTLAIAGDSFADDGTESEYDDPDRPCDTPTVTSARDTLARGIDNLPVTLLSDEEPGPEENSSQEVLDFRLQRLRNMRHRLELEGWDRHERWDRLARPRASDGVERRNSWSLRHLDVMMARSRMIDSPQRPDDLDDRADTDPYLPRTSSDAPDLNESGGSADLVPNRTEDPNDPSVTSARFHIRKGKYKVAIKFDPPVSGRYILLKLWSNRSNVDVQSVIAKGYGGGKFFPAVEYR